MHRGEDAEVATAPESAPHPDAAESAPEDAAGGADSQACPLDAASLPVPVRTLTEADALRIGRAYSDSNIARIAHVDSLLRAGAFGPPQGGPARRKAQLLARLVTLNAYAYMVRLATDPTTVWQVDESALTKAFGQFSDPGQYPIPRLRRARLGLGHLCAHYDLEHPFATDTELAGEHLHVLTQDATLEGRTQRVLVMDLPTHLFQVVQLIMAEHVTSEVDLVRSQGPPAPYEAFVVHNMHGVWVRKFGLQRPEAFIFWVTPRLPFRNDLPQKPLTGVRVYVPRLVLRLPSVLPDLGVDDLREIDLPQPVLDLDYFRQHRYPVWLKPAHRNAFQDWHSVGPVPPGIRERFPDL